MKSDAKVVVKKDGPYIISGGLPLAKEIVLVGKQGEPEFWKREKEFPRKDVCALCRCGRSKDRIFCDGTHVKVKFDGTETAPRKGYIVKAPKLSGPAVDLTDVQELCSSARFCHLGQGTWDDVENSGDPAAKKRAIQSACNCPSGRLIVYDQKTGKPIEPKLEKSISIIEDAPAGVSGPIWLKGGIPLESEDGKKYETRNRVTLCRCGLSTNKPFCDGTHMQSGFKDGDKSLK
jgi:CDGSH-type Zn-finger protein